MAGSVVNLDADYEVALVEKHRAPPPAGQLDCRVALQFRARGHPSIPIWV